jgi:hypothetical protein
MVVPGQLGVNACVSLSGRGCEPVRGPHYSSCISSTVGGDLIGTTRWTGVSLKQMLPELGLRANATHLKIHSADGFSEIVALDTIKSEARDAGLRLGWSSFGPGTWPPTAHLYSRSVWDEATQLNRLHRCDRSLEAGLLGRSRLRPRCAHESDFRSRCRGDQNDDRIEQGGKIRVAVGGIAHAGVRGISKAEVRVDDGEWMPAELRAALSGKTWVLWRYDWPSQKGRHTFTVRCFEGTVSLRLNRKRRHTRAMRLAWIHAR